MSKRPSFTPYLLRSLQKKLRLSCHEKCKRIQLTYTGLYVVFVALILTANKMHVLQVAGHTMTLAE